MTYDLYKRPKVSFETPISMLVNSLEYNDYEYALVHLFEEHPKYLMFYERNIKHRMMYLDNSAYELGASFNPQKFEEWCRHFAKIEARNLWYFLPDFPGDFEKTLENAVKFPKIIGRNGEEAHRIGVLHSHSFVAVLDQWTQLADHCDMVAIPMLLDGYMGSADYRGLEGRTQARVDLVKFLHHAMKIQAIPSRPIHLLGCLLPQEFLAYKSGEIRSLDTSNPIVHGLEGIQYGICGLGDKSKTQIHEIIDVDITDEQRKLIAKNIEAFLGFIN